MAFDNTKTRLLDQRATARPATMTTKIGNTNRICDYFLIVGTGAQLKPIKDEVAPDPDASSPPLPPPPRSYMDRLYRGHVLSRFPSEDHALCPFPEGISMFCIPDSISLTHAHELPILYFFAATQGNGAILYGTCLRFFELVPPDAIEVLEEEERQAQQTLHSISAENTLMRRNAAPSTTDSAERESNPLSQTLADSNEMEHSLSTGDRDRERGEESTLRKLKHHSRSSSPTQLASSPSHSPLAGSGRGVGGASAGGSASPPRPSRGAVNLESFAPVITATTPSVTPLAGSRNIHNNLVTTPQTSPLSVVKTLSPTRGSTAGSTVSVTRLSTANKPKPVYAPKCLCILSLQPYLEQYRVFLTELYRISLTPTHIPLERFISNFVLEIPLPPPGEVRLHYTISNQLLEFARSPANNPLKYMHSSSKNRASRILTLFELLDLENILWIFECILLEKRILFLSNKLSLLTMVSEIFLHLMYPFSWPHVYIPLLPKALIDFLNAPMPFIIGMHHSYVKGHLHGEMLIDLVVVDLDRNKVHFSNNPHALPISTSTNASSASSSSNDIFQGHVHVFLPAKERKKLKLKLKPFQALFSRSSSGSGGGGSASANVPKPPHQAYQLRVLDELDLAFPNAAHPDELESIEQYANLLDTLGQDEINISLSFFRSFVSMFLNYREYLIFPTAANPNPDPCFRIKDFMKKNVASESEEFYLAFSKTQAFQRFCEERIYASSAMPSTITKETAATLSKEAASILFFDESINAKRNRSLFSSMTKKYATPFLDLQSSEPRVVKIPPPEECGLPPPIEVSVTSPTGQQGGGEKNKRTKPFQYTYSTFPDFLDESLFYGERILPPAAQTKEVASLDTSSHASSSSSSLASGARSPGGAEGERRRSLGSIGNAAAMINTSSTHSSSGVIAPLDPVSVLETVWFTILASMSASFHAGPLLRIGLDLLHRRVQAVIAARAAAGATWKIKEGLPQPPPEDVFLRMMRACGACSLPELATDIFQNLLLRLEEYEVLNDRAAPQTAAMYTMLLSIHSMNNDHRGLKGLTKLKNPAPSPSASAHLQAPSPSSPSNDVDFPESPSSSTTLSISLGALTLAGSGSAAQSPPAPATASTNIIAEEDDPDQCSAPEVIVSPSRKTKRPAAVNTNTTTITSLPSDSKLPGSGVTSPMVGGKTIRRVLDRDVEDDEAYEGKPIDHSLLISHYQARFKAIFPSLCVDLIESCPECSKPMTDIDIRAGWSPTKDSDYTTKCPSCGERFVARFTVRPTDGATTVPANPTPTSAASSLQLPASSAPPAVDLTANISCEYLPPLVLRKEVTRVIDTYGISHIASSAFQTSSPALFFNLIWHLTNHRLPVDFIVNPEKYRPEPGTPRPGARRVTRTNRGKTPKAAQRTIAHTQQQPAALKAGTTIAAAASLPTSVDAAYRSSMSDRLDAALKRQVSESATSTSSTSTATAAAVVPVDCALAAVTVAPESADVNDADEPDSELSISLSGVSDTTDSEGDLAAELGEEFTTELVKSPTTLAQELTDGGAASASSPAQAAATMHAALLAEQRARNSSAATSSTTMTDIPAPIPVESSDDEDCAPAIHDDLDAPLP